MSTLTPLEAIRQRLAAAESNNNKNYDNANYPFWNMKQDSTSVLRFLPDADPNNTYFWAEKIQIKLPFAGIKGGEAKPVYVSVPCVEMFGRTLYPQGCPILSQIRPWYDEAKRTGDESLTKKANIYWKKPSYIMQGFVRVSTVADDVPPENPIRRFSLNKQLFNLVKSGLMDPEMLHSPCDFENGVDFKITKTTKAQYADYGTSNYSRNGSPLTKVELEAIEKYGLSNLSEFLGKKPSAEDLVVIKEMFAASVNGEQYDAEKWGQFYRPANLKAANDGEAKTTTVAVKDAVDPTSDVAAPVVHETKAEVAAPAATSGGKSAAEILAMIKNRGK